MGDPNGDWDKNAFTAKTLWDDGWSLVPIRGNGDSEVEFQPYMQSDVSRMPLDELLTHVEKDDMHMAVIMGSSFNGDLASSTFTNFDDVLAATREIGSEYGVLPVNIASDDEYTIFWLMEDDNKWILEGHEAAGEEGVFRFPDCTVRYGRSWMPIPFFPGVRWLQEPVTNQRQIAMNNLLYVDPLKAKLIPALF